MSADYSYKETFVYRLSARRWIDEDQDYKETTSVVVASSIENAIKDSKRSGLIHKKAIVYNCELICGVDHIVIHNYA